MSQKLKITLLGSPAAIVGDEPIKDHVSIYAQASPLPKASVEPQLHLH